MQQANRPRYLVAKLFAPVIGCDTSSLRALNVVALCLICPLSYGILRRLRTPVISQVENSGNTKAANKGSESSDSSVLSDANVALNIALFPPLFFFSALFYTDVMSTLIVLLSYNVLLKYSATPRSVFGDLSTVVVGVVALFFRQTNIFWVAIFPAGLSVIDALKGNASSTLSRRLGNPRDVLQRSWDEGAVYDCGVEDAEVQGICHCLLEFVDSQADHARLRTVAVLCHHRSAEKAITGYTSCISLLCTAWAFRRFRGVERQRRAW